MTNSFDKSTVTSHIETRERSQSQSHNTRARLASDVQSELTKRLISPITVWIEL